MKNILCIRLDSMGDVLMTTPAFRAIKTRFPHAKITLLTSRSGGEIARYIPQVDEAITYNAPWMNNSSYDNFDMLLHRLKKDSYDCAIIFTVYSQSPFPAALTCLLSDIPKRIAYAHENPYHLLTTWLPDPDPVKGIRHEVQRQLDLVKSISCTTSNIRLSLSIPFEEKDSVYRKLTACGIIQSYPWIIVHVGANEERRRYPKHLMVQLLTILSFFFGYQILLTGSEKEKKYIDELAENVHDPYCVSLAGVLSLGEFITLISLAPVVVSNNTGPIHIAAATQTPVIDLYAKTNPQHTPWMVKNKTFYFDTTCKACERGICNEANHPLIAYSYPKPIDIAEAVHAFVADEKNNSSYSYI